jgi:glycosyltransferase involved in cell wall biosynthesis
LSEKPFLSIIIPAHNEENRLPGTLERVLAYLDRQDYSWELIVVENGSSDRTAAVAEAAAADRPGMQVLQLTEPGKGLAVKAGMLAAAGRYRFMCDADLSMPIEEVDRFLPPAAGEYDIVIGSREAAGAVRYDETAYRHLGGRAVNLMIRLLALPGLQDTQCGFKLFTAEAAQVLFSRQTLPNFSFDIEILFAARRLGYRVFELGIPWHFSAESKVSPVADTLRMFWDILRIRWNASQGRYQ